MIKKFNNISNSELEACIDDVVRGPNAVRNRKILKDRLITGMLYEPLAEKYHLSVRQTQSIIYKASEQLFKRTKL